MMQSKPVSAAAEAAIWLREETGFGPILDATLMAGRVVVEDWTASITMSPPNWRVVPLTRRSGEMAASKVKLDALVRVPCWISEWVAGLISYQRTWEPAPPKTVCWVQSAVTPPCAGSTAETAWVLRASRVSVWLAGTGVNAAVPLAFFSVPETPAVNVLGAGQAGPAGGLVSQAMCDPAKLDPLNSLTPISWKSWVMPSLG